MARSLSAQFRCRFDAPGEQRFAFSAYPLSGHYASEDGVPVIASAGAGRRGAVPELGRRKVHRQEWNCLVTRIRDEQANGRVLNDMAIIYRNNAQAEAAERALT